MNMPCEMIQKTMGELFTCKAVGNYIRIRTPYMYPDGGYIDLFAEPFGDDKEITISDLGETTRWLRMQTITQKRSAKQLQMIEDIRMTHGVEFFKGMLLARLKPGDNLAVVITRLSQAALRISDLWFTFRSRAVESAKDEVADYLEESQVRFDRNVKLPGRSGKSWVVDFQTRTSNRSTLVYVLSTGTRGARQGITEHVFTAWSDLSQMKVGQEPLRFVSLFDDSSDVWTGEDFKLLGDLSEVVLWSDSRLFADLLGAA
jgi:hypothetical protein